MSAKVPVTSTVPLLIVKSPVNKLFPLNVNVLAPTFLIIAPPPEITPESVWFADDE